MTRLFMASIVLIICSAAAVSQTLIRVPQDQPTIQAGINAASEGDTVLVDGGTYVENIFINKKIVLGSLFLQDSNTAHKSNTIIDGSGSSNPDSGSVITLGAATDTTLVIAGFTITGGKGNKSYDVQWPAYWIGGGGIESSVGGSASIRHNIITENHLTTTGTVDSVFGAGIALWVYPRPGPLYVVIEDNDIRDNSLSGANASSGGGISIGNYQAVVRRNRVTGNTVDASPTSAQSGGIEFGSQFGDSLILVNNMITDNFASFQGGAITCIGFAKSPFMPPVVTMENNIIARDSTGNRAGGILSVGNALLMIVNNTIVGNTSTFGDGNGVYNLSGGPVRALNNIFSNSPYSNQIQGPGYYDHNLIFGQTVGTNSINADPGPTFVKFTDMYYIHSNSPAKDAGVDTATLGGVLLTVPAFCLHGFPRDANPDLGAHEFDPAVGVERLTDNLIPEKFGLSQNYPNPFNPTTAIKYQLPSESVVTLRVYDMLGRVVEVLVNEKQHAGVYQAEWDAKVASGVYFYRLEATGVNGRQFIETRKMVLVR